MIVKNEMANLDRCLSSVAPYIDCWVIGDTGSTDGTQDFIRAFFAERGIPGELHEFPFHDFAQARNEALTRARTSKLRFDYVLLTDADMELVVDDETFPERLSAAAYKVLQRSGVAYWNIRLVGRKVPSSYKGVTHEYLDIRKGETLNLEGISYIDHATGSNRVDKYERDVRLLKRAIEKETDPGMIARYTFYLANTYRDAGQPEEAIKAYGERARRGGWAEEVFVSQYNIARIKEELGRPDDEVIAAYETAAKTAPWRAEALHAAARFCRDKGRHAEGYDFAKRGLAVPYPKDSLFVQDWIHEYGLLDEFAVNAFWVGAYEACMAACDTLLADCKIPEAQRARVAGNRALAASKLAEASDDSYLVKLQAARAREQLGGDAEEILAAYAEAAEAAPYRAEALHAAARFCRNKGLHERGYQYAVRGLTIPPPTTGPTNEAWIYDYGLLDELAVNAYWTGRYAESADACDQLLRNGRLPASQRERVAGNRQFALDRIAEASAVDETTAQATSSDSASIKREIRDAAGIRTFDLFDTLIARRDPDPTEVFRIVERRSGYAGFESKRLAAEAELLTTPYVLSDIYARLVAAFDVAPDVAEQLKALELAVEEECIFPIAENMRLVGPNDAIVSDMYLGLDDLRGILQRSCSISPPRLVVSSHGKRSGLVWPELLAESPILEHLGDNPVTDESSPKAAGVPARLTLIAQRTPIESELADQGFVPLANLVREARLTTWSDDATVRQAQLAQIQVNFPLIFLSNLHLMRRAREIGWDNILFSARDCFLWSKLYDDVRRRLTDLPPASYFYTGRTTRAHPSADYLGYFSRLRIGRSNVVVDLCGTGWSLSRLIEQSPTPATDIFLLHKIELPHLVEQYSKHGDLERPISAEALIRRGPQRADNDVLEDLNRAPHPAVEDVRRDGDVYLPVFSDVAYPADAAALMRAHHTAFLVACRLLDTIDPSVLRAMSDRDTTSAICSQYGRMDVNMLPALRPLFNHKLQEEPHVWERLRELSSTPQGEVPTDPAA